MLTQARTPSTASTAEVFNALRAVGDVLHQNFVYGIDGNFHFPLGDGWSISLCADSADRIQIQACRFADPVTTLWSSVRDRSRLSSIVSDLAFEIQLARSR